MMQKRILFVRNIFSRPLFFGRGPKEAVLKRRSVDKEKIERADRESKLVLEAERKARDDKTARLRQMRLTMVDLSTGSKPSVKLSGSG